MVADLDAYKKYTVSWLPNLFKKEKQLIVLKKCSHTPEIAARFGELVSKVTQENGRLIEYNLDALNQTKNDPKVGAAILQEM